MFYSSGVAKGGPEWARAHPNFPRMPACYYYYEQETSSSAYLGSTILSL